MSRESVYPKAAGLNVDLGGDKVNRCGTIFEATILVVISLLSL